MWLVGQRRQREMDCADDLSVLVLCDEQNPRTLLHVASYLGPETLRIIARQCGHEADGGAALDAIDQHVAELLDVFRR